MSEHFSLPVFKANYSTVLYVSVCLVSQSCPTLCDPMYFSLPGSPELQYKIKKLFLKKKSLAWGLLRNGNIEYI
jgi:hypothetical protein